MATRKKSVAAPKVKRANLGAESLKYLFDWSRPDIQHPWILLETASGAGLPGGASLTESLEDAKQGVLRTGGTPGVGNFSDFWSAVPGTGTGFTRSIAHRELISLVAEYHATSGEFDAAVYLSGGGPALWGQVLAAARSKIPGVFLLPGSSPPGPGSPWMKRPGAGVVPQRKRKSRAEKDAEARAADSAGHYETSTLSEQVMIEGLGLAIPASSMVPRGGWAMRRMSINTGTLAAQLGRMHTEGGWKPVLTSRSIQNALVLHAACAGSPESVLNLMAVAKALNVKFDLDMAAKVHQKVPLLVNVHPGGRHPEHLFWYAGGTARLMLELKDHLALDAVTVTGRTLGENIQELERAGHFTTTAKILEGYGLRPGDVIRTIKDPVARGTGTLLLKGNLAPKGALVHARPVAAEMTHFIGHARVFESQAEALEGLQEGKVKPGDCIVIRGVGPLGGGFQDLGPVAASVADNPILSVSVALVSDGRFSLSSQGPCVGKVTPEAATAGSPLAAVENGDLIHIDLHTCTITLAGIDGEKLTPKEIEKVLKKRLKGHKGWKAEPGPGLASLFPSSKL